MIVIFTGATDPVANTTSETVILHSVRSERNTGTVTAAVGAELGVRVTVAVSHPSLVMLSEVVTTISEISSS